MSDYREGWQALLAQLGQRRGLAEAIGGQERIDRQHERDRLTTRAAAGMFAAQRRYRGVKIVVTLRKAFGFGSSVMGMNPWGPADSMAFDKVIDPGDLRYEIIAVLSIPCKIARL